MRFITFLKEAKAKIKVEHPGILEVPEGKYFWELPISHYEKLIKKKGYRAIIRALTNIEVWNKNRNPIISAKAKKIIVALQKKFKKED